MTLDVYTDLFVADLDDAANNLDAAIRSDAYPLRTGNDKSQAQLTMMAVPAWSNRGGAKGIRTPDLLDANESYSPHLGVCCGKL
jgi:hypothetical protein